MDERGGAPEQPDRTAWSALEHETAAAYRALGYEVERDVYVEGQQVDVLARRRVPGTGTIVVGVECAYRASGSLPNDKVADFAFSYLPLVLSGAIDKAVLVSNGEVTRHGRAVLRDKRGLHVTTLQALRGQVLDPAPAFSSFVDHYESSVISATFVEPDLRGLGSNDEPAATRKRALVAVDDMLASPYRLLIVADFGAGKSTLLERVKYEYARRYLSTGQPPIPLLFRLQDYGQFASLDEYVRWNVQREFGSEINLDAFWSVLDRGHLLVLLDGFDEIATRVDASERQRLMLSLSPLLNSRSPALLTTRPGYFGSLRELHGALRALRSEHEAYAATAGADADRDRPDLTELVMRRHVSSAHSRRYTMPAFAVSSLEPLTSGQITQYLAKYEAQFASVLNMDSAAVAEFVAGIYDLSDLMRRPILLDMIIDTILSGRLNIKSEQPIYPAELYEAYTTAKLGIDWDRSPSRRASLTTDERRQFAQRCALEIATTDAPIIPVDRVNEIVESIVGRRGEPITVGEALTDLRTCSFLTIDDIGRLRFIHKSFSEFFLARSIVQWLRAGNAELGALLARHLATEVLQFLADFFSSDDLLLRQWLPLAPSTGGPTGEVTRNVLGTALMVRGRRSLMKGLRDATVWDFVARDLVGSRCIWTSVRLDNFEAQQLAFVASHLTGLRISRAILRDGISLRTTSADLEISESSLGSLGVEGGTARLYGDRAVTGQVTLSGAAVTLDGSWEASEIACTDSALAWDGTLKARSLRIERAASVVGGAAEETSDVRIISPNEVSVNATRASSFETVAVSESVVGFRGVTACRRSRFRRSVLVIADQVSAQSLLTNATLESCVVISCSGGAASIKVSPSMNDCLVFGLTFDDVDALDVSGVVFHRRPIESDYLTRAAKVDYQHLGDQGEGLSPGNQPRARVAGSQPRGAALGNQQRPRPTTFHPRANGLGLLIADSRSEIQFRFVKFAGAIARALLSGHLNVEAAVAQLISVVGAASLSPDAAAMALPSSISSTICSQQIQRMRTVLA